MSSISAMRRCALTAAFLMLAMIIIFVSSGIGQESLQIFNVSETYAQILLRDPEMLRVVIGLDNAFLLMYASCFLLLGRYLTGLDTNRTLVFAGTGLLMLTATLDITENLHYLTMNALAEKTLTINVSEISLQVWASLLKFHVSYLGLFFLGLVIPATTLALRLLTLSLKYIQWPIGILIYVVPASWMKPLVFTRLSFFLLGLLIVAFTDWSRIGDSSVRR